MGRKLLQGGLRLGSPQASQERFEVEHFFHVGHEDELDAAVLFAPFGGVVGGDGIGLAVAGGAPVLGIEVAALALFGGGFFRSHLLVGCLFRRLVGFFALGGLGGGRGRRRFLLVAF